MDVVAENRANYRTLGTGAAVAPFDSNSNCIAVGVAVSVNDNEANARLQGEVEATGDEETQKSDGDVRVTSTLTQNMDGRYRGLLGAQALAGSVSGQGGKVGFAGAVAILITKARANAVIAKDAVVTAGDILVEAIDQSKLAVRAGGLTASGSQMGVGGSFALIYADNALQALIDDGAHIFGRSLRVNAEKKGVSSQDYQFPFDWSALFTTNVTEEQKKGIINIDTENSKNGIIGINYDNIIKTDYSNGAFSCVNVRVGSIKGNDITLRNVTVLVLLLNLPKCSPGTNIIPPCIKLNYLALFCFFHNGIVD